MFMSGHISLRIHSLVSLAPRRSLDTSRFSPLPAFPKLNPSTADGLFTKLALIQHPFFVYMSHFGCFSQIWMDGWIYCAVCPRLFAWRFLRLRVRDVTPEAVKTKLQPSDRSRRIMTHVNAGVCRPCARCHMLGSGSHAPARACVCQSCP